MTDQKLYDYVTAWTVTAKMAINPWDEIAELAKREMDLGKHSPEFIMKVVSYCTKSLHDDAVLNPCSEEKTVFRLQVKRLAIILNRHSNRKIEYLTGQIEKQTAHGEPCLSITMSMQGSTAPCIINVTKSVVEGLLSVEGDEQAIRAQQLIAYAEAAVEECKEL